MRALLAEVADTALGYPYRVWGLAGGPALLGLLAAGELLGREDLVEAVDAIVRPSLGSGGPEEHLVPVDMLLRLHQLGSGLDVGQAVESWAHCIETAPTPVAGRPRVHRRDPLGLGDLVWVYCIHTDGPGLAPLGRSTPTAVVEESASVLQDVSGLFHHGYDVSTGRVNGSHWGRGQGWALRGLVGTLVNPDEALQARLDALLAAVAATEEQGRWRTIIDEPDARYEASVSALVAAGLLSGMPAGVVLPQHAVLAERAPAAAVRPLTAISPAA